MSALAEQPWMQLFDRKGFRSLHTMENVKYPAHTTHVKIKLRLCDRQYSQSGLHPAICSPKWKMCTGPQLQRALAHIKLMRTDVTY